MLIQSNPLYVGFVVLDLYNRTDGANVEVCTPIRQAGIVQSMNSKCKPIMFQVQTEKHSGIERDREE